MVKRFGKILFVVTVLVFILSGCKEETVDDPADTNPDDLRSQLVDNSGWSHFAFDPSFIWNDNRTIWSPRDRRYLNGAVYKGNPLFISYWLLNDGFDNIRSGEWRYPVDGKMKGESFGGYASPGDKGTEYLPENLDEHRTNAATFSTTSRSFIYEGRPHADLSIYQKRSGGYFYTSLKGGSDLTGRFGWLLTLPVWKIQETTDLYFADNAKVTLTQGAGELDIGNIKGQKSAIHLATYVSRLTESSPPSYYGCLVSKVWYADITDTVDFISNSIELSDLNTTLGRSTTKVIGDQTLTALRIGDKFKLFHGNFNNGISEIYEGSQGSNYIEIIKGVNHFFVVYQENDVPKALKVSLDGVVSSYASPLPSMNEASFTHYKGDLVVGYLDIEQNGFAVKHVTSAGISSLGAPIISKPIGSLYEEPMPTSNNNSIVLVSDGNSLFAAIPNDTPPPRRLVADFRVGVQIIKFGN
jgi:hypothetical protein